MPRRSLFVLIFGGLLACSAPERRVEWGYRFRPTTLERSPVQLIASLTEGCEPGARELDRWVVGQGAPSMERRSTEPALAISLRAIAPEPGCPVYALGCSLLGEGRTEIVLAEAVGAPICPGDGLCAQLSCETPRDAGVPRDASVVSDAGGMDGGPTDGGRYDAGLADAGTPTACEALRASGATVWSCDDFDGMRDPTVTFLAGGSGTAALVSTMARSGDTSVRLQVVAPWDTAGIRATAIPSGSADLWMRAWVLFEELPFDFDFLYVFGAGEMGGRGIATVINPSRHVALWLGSEEPPVWHDYQTAGYPTGWTCVEQRVRVGASAIGLVENFANGSVLRAVTGNTAGSYGPYEEYRLGFLKTRSTSGPGTLYVDDVATGPERLPCP